MVSYQLSINKSQNYIEWDHYNNTQYDSSRYTTFNTFQTIVDTPSKTRCKFSENEYLHDCSETEILIGGADEFTWVAFNSIYDDPEIKVPKRIKRGEFCVGRRKDRFRNPYVDNAFIEYSESNIFSKGRSYFLSMQKDYPMPLNVFGFDVLVKKN